MRKIFFLFIIVFLLNDVYPQDEENRSKLVIFVNSNKTEAGNHFEKNALPEIRKITKEKSIELEVIESSKGIPAEITTLPTIVFVGESGRTIYQGRYLTFDRIANFIETSQNISQSEELSVYKEITVSSFGRAMIGVPVKISDVTGTKPKNYEQNSFVAESLKVVLKELHGYEFKTKVLANRTDRFFYMDFYPWLSEDGQLYLSAALFSQYHCKLPIWTTDKSPFVGGWNNRKTLFLQATARMEEEIKKHSKYSLVGDAFDVIDDTIKKVSWEELGLKISNKKKVAGTIIKGEIAKAWVVDSGKGQKSIVQFRLVPPNESYTGFAKNIFGEINFTEINANKKMQGSFKVKMDSVTMGEADLDAELFTKKVLNVKEFPLASFDFDVLVNPDSFNIYFGRENILDVLGKFTFKDKTIPLQAEFSLEPIVKNGVTQLVLKSNFRFNLKDFGLSGAPNYTEEKDLIEFFITLEMVQK